MSTWIEPPSPSSTPCCARSARMSRWSRSWKLVTARRFQPKSRSRRSRRRQLVEVEQRHVDRVAEDVVVRRPARVHDGADVEGAVHHGAPKAAAARRPEARPSSWKPLPCQAPANAVRRSDATRAGPLRGRETRERHARVLVVDHADHVRASISLGPVERHAVLDAGLELLEPVEGVRERRLARRSTPQPGDW